MSEDRREIQSRRRCSGSDGGVDVMSCDVARRRPTILVPYLRFLHMEDSRRVSRILGSNDKELQDSRERARCGVAPRRVGTTLLL